MQKLSFLLIITIGLFFSGIFLLACKPVKTVVNTFHQDEVIFMKYEQVPPSSCRIRAEIIAADTIITNQHQDDPCVKYPCHAKVSVLEVLASGQGFVNVLSEGDTLNLHFTFSLHSMDETNMPGLKISLPGLEVGDRFIADVRQKPEIGGGFSYQVGVYEKY